MIFGIRPVIEAIDAGKSVEKLFMLKGFKSEIKGRLHQLLKENSIPYQYVPVQKLNKLTPKNHQGVIAMVSPIAFHDIKNLLPGIFEAGKIPFLLILDRISDVRNFGAIARTAECMGVDAIIIPSKGAAQVNGDAIKTSAGALHKIAVCRVPSLQEIIHFLKDSGLKIVSCSEKTSKTVSDVNFQDPVAIIMGSEENGISKKLLEISDSHAKIPMTGEIQSLNVSVATGMILYEVTRQRKV